MTPQWLNTICRRRSTSAGKYHRITGVRLLRLALVWGYCLLAPAARSDNYTPYVNPFVGTARQGTALAGNTFPGAATPFGMVQFGPDTYDAFHPSTQKQPNGLTDNGYSYSYNDTSILGFSLTHQSGTGIASFGDVRIMPTTGPITNPEDYASSFDHANEAASPGYYRVFLNRWGVNSEFTATPRVGITRLTFPPNIKPNLLLPISRTLTMSYSAIVQIVGSREIVGSITSQTVKTPLFTVYFCLQFDQPAQASGVWQNGVVTPGASEVVQSSGSDHVGAYVSFAASSLPRVINVRIGISFVDIDGARNNLATEAPQPDSFDSANAAARDQWETELHTIAIKTNSVSQMQAFYSALYHCLLHPNLFSDADGRWMGFDNQVHQAPPGHNIYTNYSGWDIYRTEIPLLTLIEPARVQDMAQSMVEVYNQTAWLGRWLQANQFTSSAIGTPFTPFLATLINSGLTGFDTATAYAAMWHEATTPTPRGGSDLGQEGEQYMKSLGYLPCDKIVQSVSKTEEYCYAYAALSLAATALGRSADAAQMAQASLLYRHLFDPATGFIRPRNSDGSWFLPFDPTLYPCAGNPFYEGTGWEYLWQAPHDVKGLIGLLGGAKAFCKRLDAFFSGYYDPSNEADIQVPFYYMYAGQPWKTQILVERFQAGYTANPDGLPGNDDCGTMSAWYVLSALGLYPTDPARAAFEITTPRFESATLTVAPGTSFRVVLNRRNSSRAFITRTTFRGRPTRSWLSTQQIRSGGTLVVVVRLFPGPGGSAPPYLPPL